MQRATTHRSLLTQKLGKCVGGKRLISAYNSVPRVPVIQNEPMFNYEKGSPERAKLEAEVKRMREQPIPEITPVVGGKKITTGKFGTQTMPSDHSKALCKFHLANEDILRQAIDNALAAKHQWENMSFVDRASIFLRAADLLSTKYRYKLLAATMLGQGKTAWQAEIDAAAELADFWRFNVMYAQEIYEQQPPRNAPYVWNRLEHRPLEGFVLAVSPFNFTAIGGNLCSAPALMGNVVLWKPSETAMYSNYIVYEILREAGLPDGVIQFLPADGPTVGNCVTKHPDFAALHFTGSTKTFKHLWSQIAQNIDTYKSFPRIVGETGGKNFHFVHETADVENVVNQTVRGAFEYSGQKCSACSRLYVPDTLWPEVKEKLVQQVQKLKVGQPDDFTSFTSSVIDKASFEKISKYIDGAKNSPDCEILVGGTYDKSVGYFVQPTIIQTKNPHYTTMEEEIFGPVLTVYVYQADQYEQALELCDKTGIYALTGSIFARDRHALAVAQDKLRHAAGNFYINDKSTGAVVGQQPFGGARKSGTNDKAGSAAFLSRWVSARAVKETHVPLTSWAYPSIDQ